MEPVDPFWNLVIRAATAFVAVAALILSVMNYRREKRRDEVRLHVALRTNQLRKAGDSTLYADSLTAEVTNTGQRPTTVQAVALSPLLDTGSGVGASGSATSGRSRTRCVLRVAWRPRYRPELEKVAREVLAGTWPLLQRGK